MEVLVIQGKKYVKASAIARELGYTNDYVGQLCRAGKVDATLVGRSWYVHEDSLRNHKGTRYRSTKGTTLRQLDRDVGSKSRGSVPQPKRASVATHTFSKAVQGSAAQTVHLNTGTSELAHRPSYIKYAEDSESLLPKVKKSHTPKAQLDVQLADAATLTVAATNDHYKLRAGALPQLRFKGSLAISDLDSVEDESTAGDNASESYLPMQEVETTPAPVTSEDSLVGVEKPKMVVEQKTRVEEKTSKIKIKLNYKRKNRIPVGEPHERNPYGLMEMKRHSSVAVEGGTLHLKQSGFKPSSVAREVTSVSGVRFILWGFLFGACLGGVAAVGILGATVTTSVAGTASTSHYTVSFQDGWRLLLQTVETWRF